MYYIFIFLNCFIYFLQKKQTNVKWELSIIHYIGRVELENDDDENGIKKVNVIIKFFEKKIKRRESRLEPVTLKFWFFSCLLRVTDRI